MTAVPARPPQPSPPPGSSPLRRGILGLVTLAGGVSLAVIPAATLSIGSRLFSTTEQGFLAVAVLVATLAGQLSFAVVVESRLASAGTARRVVFPRWLALLSLPAALAVAVAGGQIVVLCLALPVLVAALEVGRGVSVAERLDHREIAASVLVGAGALAGVLAGFAEQGWALAPLATGIALATLVRCAPVPHRASIPHRATTAWIVADTAVTGAVPPLLNALILALIGPAGAVLFTAVSTVSGLLAIPLNYLRLRLLKEHSRLDVVLAAGSVGAAVAVLVVLDLTGVLGYLFGAAWTTGATLLTLLVACLWRAASLVTTLPFTALRRAGHAALVTALRAAVSVLTVVLALAGLGLQSLPLVFGGLLVAELLSAGVYETARRRVGAG